MVKGDYARGQERRAEIVEGRTDGLASNLDFEAKLGGVPVPLVSEEGLEAARAYGVLDDAGKRSRRAIFVIDEGGKVLHVVPWFQPGNPDQYEKIFAALGFDI